MEFLNRDVDFTNYDIVRNLIFNRQYIESISHEQQGNKFLSHEVTSFDLETSEYVREIYDTLDRYIIICEFNETNTMIIRELYRGASISEVKETCGIKGNTDKTIFNRVRRIVNRINLVARLERG